MNEQNSNHSNPESRKRRLIVWGGIVAAILVLIVIFRDPLVAWFFPNRQAATATEAAGDVALSDETVEEIRAALGAYEQIRLLLAADTIEGIEAHADHLAALLREARERGPETGAPISRQLDDATAAADRLREVSTIEDARAHFGELSSHLIAVVSPVSGLRAGWHLFSCPMVEGEHNLWLQPSDQLENPYMGQEMPSCGSVESWPAQAPSTVENTGTHLHDGDEVAHWTCPMHPSVKQARAGKCPICGMDLLPVSKRDLETGVLLVDDAARRRIGVKTAVVEEKPVELTIRAVGQTAFDESRLRDVTLKLKGWVERLYVNETGQPVRRGQPLLAIYSPELYSAQQEYLLA
ncbi:MAG: efflux RND transporter periplasmic adaptor subunit, partial [Thermoanaerobaculia bacterium]|nr:efflux RND transporter periplasmic adaptor subunit [Thermoanaerobaculia bacterium]